MILYFADRHLNILGQASTHLPKGIIVTDDLKTEDVETGVAIFECDLHFNKSTRAKVEAWAELGNYILRSSDDEQELFTIIDAEIDTKKQRAYIYAEDNGLDLLNEVVGEYEADQPYPISFYIEKYAAGSGWEIGINEVEGLTRQLTFDNDETTSARLLRIAEAFNNCELSFSFKIDGLKIVKRYINIYEERGKDTGVQLRLNKEIDGIVTTKSIANLATALKATGGTPDNSEEPITLKGYVYDDGDFYVEGSILKSRKALEKWSRYLWKGDETQQQGGHIVKPYSDESLSQAVLCENTIAELKSIRDMEINYEADIKELPDNVRIGDRVNIIDDEGELYLSSRVLVLETSEADKTRRAILGEHLIRKSGISSKVEKLAAQFAKSTKSAARAAAIAENAKELAEAAKTQADTALTESEAAQTTANAAKTAAEAAEQSALTAKAQAEAAEAAVNAVEETVAGYEQAIENAKNAANNAHTAAETATQKAEEAKTAAENAESKATEAETAAGNAETAANNAVNKANEAEGTANTAKTKAEAASATAQAAKLDAEQAEKDVAALGNELETVKTTMTADYARKTDLTETEAHLQTQISQNADEIEQTASKVVYIDETANNAAELANAAFYGAAEAQAKATEAAQLAATAQTEADNARIAAEDAQAEADTAKTAAETAQEVADKAEADLIQAQKDLDEIRQSATATEAEIAAAELAVQNAQTAADNAQSEAAAAVTAAENAQKTADTAADNATNAQLAAEHAAKQAEIAQQAAEKVSQSAAAEALAKANEAQNIADTAQETANTANANATAAQTTADQAAAAAANAQKAADDAEAKAAQAETDLETAKQNLANVTSRVDATEEEVAAAQAAVETAQAAADKAKQDATAAQSTADTAKANAAAAQTAANNAKTAADNAQTAANEAKAAADKAQEDVNKLAVRVTSAETKITQNSEQIALRATKTEVETYVNNIKVGGRNLLSDSTNLNVWAVAAGLSYSKTEEGYLQIIAASGNENWASVGLGSNYTLVENELSEGDEFVISFTMRSPDATTPPLIYIKPGMGYYSMNGTLSEKWATVWYSGTWKDAETITPHFGFSNLAGTFEIKNCKIEKGTKCTDWTPAPEEYYTKSETDAAITVEADKIESSVSKVHTTAEGNTERITAAESLIQQFADSISMLVTDGNGTSLMTQTEDGWTFSTSEIQGALNSLSEALESLDNDLGDTEAVVTVLKQAVDDIGLKTDYVNLGTYTYTNDEGEEVTEPCVELGESDNDYKVLITNTQILFKVGSAAPTRINAEGLITENITVKNELRQTNDAVDGSYIWAVRENGHYGLQWKGADAQWQLFQNGIRLALHQILQRQAAQ